MLKGNQCAGCSLNKQTCKISETCKRLGGVCCAVSERQILTAADAVKGNYYEFLHNGNWYDGKCTYADPDPTRMDMTFVRSNGQVEDAEFCRVQEKIQMTVAELHDQGLLARNIEIIL